MQYIHWTICLLPAIFHLYSNLVPNLIKETCGKQNLQEITELPDCTASINISGSSRVMTDSSQKQQPTNTMKKFKVTEDVVFRGYQSFHKFSLVPYAQTVRTHSPPQCSYQFIHPSSKSRWHRVELLADRKPKGVRVKTYEVWLEQ